VNTFGNRSIARNRSKFVHTESKSSLSPLNCTFAVGDAALYNNGFTLNDRRIRRNIDERLLHCSGHEHYCKTSEGADVRDVFAVNLAFNVHWHSGFIVYVTLGMHLCSVCNRRTANALDDDDDDDDDYDKLSANATRRHWRSLFVV